MSRLTRRPYRRTALLFTAGFLLALAVSCRDDERAAGAPALDAGDASSIDVSSVPDASFIEPDENEPNDTTPTSIVLSPGADGISTGTTGGAIGNGGDVDRFVFDVPAGGDVLYVRVTAPALASAATGIRYELRRVDQDGGALVAEGEEQDLASAVDLGTAQRIDGARRYELVVRGTNESGEPRRRYDVVVESLPVADESEPNDVLSSATSRVLTTPGGSSLTVAGRVGWIGDQDWLSVELPAHAAPTLLTYRLVPRGPGRFPRLPGPADLRLRVVSVVSKGATATDRRDNCKSDPSVCPKGYDGTGPWAATVTSVCNDTNAPLCLLAERAEHAPHVALANFAGSIPVAAHGASVRLYLVVENAGGDGADDVPYDIELGWLPDPDEAGRMSGVVEDPITTTLAEDPSGATYPSPPPTSTKLAGALTYGFGLTTSLSPESPESARGPDDYDAVPSDVDTYILELPALSPPLDRTWALEWTVTTEDAAVPAYNLAVDAELCDGDVLQAGGTCTPVTTTKSGGPIRLAWPGIAAPWTAPAGASIPHFTQATSSIGVLDAGTLETATTTTAAPEGCLCFEPRFVRGGSVVLRVRATDRKHYGSAKYEIRTAVTSYPKASCPAPNGSTPGCRILE